MLMRQIFQGLIGHSILGIRQDMLVGFRASNKINLVMETGRTP